MARLSVEQRRAQLLDVGKRVFSTRSYDEVSTDELSELAGISKGLLYHYFGNKRGYYVATMEEAARELLAATEPQADTDFITALRDSLTAYLDWMEANDRLYRALIRGGVGADPQVDALVEQVRRATVNRVMDKAGLGELDPRLDTQVYGWVGFVEHASIRWLERRDLERAELGEILFTALTLLLPGFPGGAA